MKRIHFDYSDSMFMLNLPPDGSQQRRGVTICLCLGLFLVTLVCSAFSSVSPPLVLTAANNGTTIASTVGKPFVVKLADNSGSMGYEWSFLISQPHVITLQSTHYLMPTFAPGSPPRVGASGFVEFTFVAQNSGNASLQFVLKRSWEKNVPPAQHFGVLIHVAPVSIHNVLPLPMPHVGPNHAS